MRRLVRGRRLVWGQRVPPAGPLDSCDSNRGRGLVWGRSGCMALMWGTVMLWRRRGEDAQLLMDGPAWPGWARRRDPLRGEDAQLLMDGPAVPGL